MPTDLDLEELAQAIKRAENPFDSDKVLKARDRILDVQEIHRRDQELLASELEEVRKSGRSRGILVTGVSGSGKSHLIARLYTERPKDVLFFQVQALPGGTAWLKHIVQCIVSDLEQPICPEDGSRQIVLLIKHFIKGTKQETAAAGKPVDNLQQLDMALESRQQQIRASMPDPVAGEVLKVLVNLWKWQSPPSRRRRGHETNEKIELAVRWLKGSMLEAEELRLIGVNQNFGTTKESGQADYLAALRVFGILTRGQAPIILVFDQLDTSESNTINSLGNQLLHLIGSESAAPNYLIVTAGVREQMDGFVSERIITPAVADVIFKTRIDLPSLDIGQCESIVKKRLAGLLTPKERQLLPIEADSLFPFTRPFLVSRLAGPIKPPARQVITAFRAVFRELKDSVSVDWFRKWPSVLPLGPGLDGVPPPSPKIVSFLTEELGKRVAKHNEAKVTGPMDDDLLAATIRILVKTTHANGPLALSELPTGQYRTPAPSFFGVRSNPDGEVLVGVVANSKGSGNSLKAVLVKVKEFLEPAHPERAVLLVRDSRAKQIGSLTVCEGLIAELGETGRFALQPVRTTDIVLLKALDELRRDVRDLVVPPTSTHGLYQVKEEDFSHFLAQSEAFLNFSVVVAVKALSGADSSDVEIRSKAKAFIRARIETKKIYGFAEIARQWANLHDRDQASHKDRQVLDAAVSSLQSEGVLLNVGSGVNRLLKKSKA